MGMADEDGGHGLVDARPSALRAAGMRPLSAALATFTSKPSRREPQAT
jgi:hypothetical protein